MNFYAEEQSEEALQLVLKNALKAEKGQSLKAILALYTMDKLKSLAGTYEIPNRWKMKKDDLVDAVHDNIILPTHISDALLLMDGEEYAFFQACARGEDFTNQVVKVELYGNLWLLGYVHILNNQGQLVYEVPQEVRQALVDLLATDFQAKRNDYWEKWLYMNGLANFYGMVTFEEVLAIYNAQQEQPTSIEALNEVFDFFQQEDQLVDFHKNHIIHNYLLDETEFDAFKESREGKPSYVPDQAMIMAYADEAYFEITPSLTKLRKYLLENFSSDMAVIDELVDAIQLGVVLEKPFQELINLFDEHDQKFTSEEQVEELSVYLTNVMNNTRLWSNKGYTQLELNEITGEGIFEVPIIEMEKQAPIRVEKIGRNELCPCGSGKKYKKCCGQ